MAAGNQTLRDSLLSSVDILRGLPAALGLRLHTVTVRVRIWSDERPGKGNDIQRDTSIKVNFALGNVKVRNMSQKDVIASGSLYTEQDLVVGPVTPPYIGSTVDNDQINVFDPDTSQSPIEVFFNIKGPGYSSQGDWFKKVGQRVDQPFRYMIYLRKTGEQP